MPAALQGPSGQVPLNTPVFTLGRATGNQLVLNDIRASAHHAVLQLQGQSYTITDTSSSNGTFVNEQQLMPNVPVLLKNRDKIRIGETTYTYEDSTASPFGSPTVAGGYDPTVKASQPPPYNSFGQEAGAYGQSTPSSPNYPQNYPSNQGMPSAPNFAESQGTQLASGASFGQEAGTYGQSTPSSPNYPQNYPSNQGMPSAPNFAESQGTQLASGASFGQEAGAYGQSTPSSPNYPQNYPSNQGMPSAPNFAPNQGTQLASGASFGQEAGAYGYPPAQNVQTPYGQPAYPPNSQPGVGSPYNPTQPPAYSGASNWNANAAPVVNPAMPGTFPPAYTPPVLVKKKHGLRNFLIILLIVVVVLGGGISAFIYFTTRPQPVIHVTSNYTVGSTPAGAEATTFHITGQKFSGDSSVTFLIDGNPVPGNGVAHSDSKGNVASTLTVTNAWAVGNHTITARDASNYVTKTSVPVTIVTAGQAHTPGPNGAPSDDFSGTVQASIQGTSGAETIALIVTGKPDGGTVCRSDDDGQPHTATGVINGVAYSETAIGTCSGRYKGGKLSYKETLTKDELDFTDGVVCTAHVPYVSRHLEGTFSNATTVSGTSSTDAITIDCNMGVGSTTTKPESGTWTGIATPS